MKPYTAADFQLVMHGLEPRMEELAYLQAAEAAKRIAC